MYMYLHIYVYVKIGVELVNQEKRLVELAGCITWRKPTVRSVMLFGVIDILFSCTPRLFAYETMVHRDRAR